MNYWDKKGVIMTPQIKQRLDPIQRGEVPKGYKRTKVGIVPSDWEETRFKRMFSRLSRKNKENNDNVLTISAQYGLISQRDFFNKDIASEDKTNYFLLHKGEFAYNKSYSNGYPFGALKRLDMYEKGIVSPLYICFSANEENRCPDFYVHYFEAGMMNREIQAFAQEGARNHGLLNISVDDFFNSYLLMPPLSEQQKIAEILSAQDKLIALKEKLIEEKKRQKKYLMQQLLTGKKRLPGFSGEWEKKKIKDICIDVITGNTPSKKDEALWNGKFPWITSQDFCGKYINQSSVTLSPMGKEQCRVVPAKSVLITCIASIGLNAITNIECATNQQINAVVCASEEVAEYVYYHMEMQVETMKRLAGKTAVPIINKSQFENFPIIFPHDNAEMKKIVEYLSAYDKEIELLDMQLNQEKQKKKALMQLLLTGIVRVNV